MLPTVGDPSSAYLGGKKGVGGNAEDPPIGQHLSHPTPGRTRVLEVIIFLGMNLA